MGQLLISILHHLDDADDPQGTVDAYVRWLVPGSMMALSHFYNPTGIGEPCLSEKALRCEQVVLTNVGSGRFRTRSEINAYFDGVRVDEYGVGYLPHWWPAAPVDVELSDDRRLVLGGVGHLAS